MSRSANRGRRFTIEEVEEFILAHAEDARDTRMADWAVGLMVDGERHREQRPPAPLPDDR